MDAAARPRRRRWLAGLIAMTTAVAAAPFAVPEPATASTPPPASCASGTTMLSEDFASGAIPSGWSAKAGTWTIADGALTGTGTASAANPTRIVTDAAHLERFCLDFTMRFSSTTATTRWAGAILDLDPTVSGGPWQHGMMRQNGTVAFGTRTAANTGWGTDITGTAQTALALGQDVRLTMIVDGGYGEIWYSPDTEKEPVRIASTTALKRSATGTIGFLLDGATVRYDDITLTELPPAGALAVTAPADKSHTAGSPTAAWSPIVGGGKPGYTWSATGLPAGLSINATTGAVTGTPTTAGEYSTTITATDAAKATATATLRYAIAPKLTLAKPDDRSATVVDGASFYFSGMGLEGQASGGREPYSWSATGLPPGIELNTDGVLLIEATTAGTYTATVVATDANGASAKNTFTYTVSPRLAVDPAPPAAAAGVPIKPWKATVTGGKSPYTWTAGGLPSGLTMDRVTGLISGTPTAEGNWRTWLEVGDGNYTHHYVEFSYSINGPLTALSQPDAYATLGSAVAAWTPTVEGGAAPYTWSATGLPAGLTINASTGAITGTPTTATAYRPTVTVSDASGGKVTGSFAYTVAPRLAVAKPASQTVTAGSAGSPVVPVVSGGRAPYTWTQTGLPAGLQFDAATGTVSGAATTAGTATATLAVTDANGAKATTTVGYTVSAPLSVSVPAGQALSIPHTAPITAWTPTATGGKTALAWTATGLPAGLTIAPTTGAVSGTPTAVGSSTVTITVTDANKATASTTFAYTVTPLVCIPIDRVPAAGDTGDVIAHRGNDGSDGFADNTLGGIANAFAKGADSFEIDIHLTNDNVPVVYHDSIGNVSLAQFRASKPGMPTLAEVAAWMKTSGARMLLEYKGAWSVAGAAIVTDVLREHGVWAQTVSQSFTMQTLDNVRAVDPEMPLMLLYDYGIDTALIQNVQSHRLNGISTKTTPSADTMRSVHAAGLKAYVWTKNSASDWATATKAGVDGIITDNTSALVSWYAAYNAPLGLASCRS